MHLDGKRNGMMLILNLYMEVKLFMGGIQDRQLRVAEGLGLGLGIGGKISSSGNTLPYSP